MRRSLLLLLLALLVLVLVGCEDSLHVDMDTRIRSNSGLGELIVTVSGTGAVNEALHNGDFADYFVRVEEAGFLVRQYTEGESAFVEVSSTFESLADLNTLQADLLAPLRLSPLVQREDRPGFFASRHIFDVTFKPVVDDSNSIPTWLGEKHWQETDGQPAIFLTYRLTTPGKILSSNALSVEKNSAIWTLSDIQMQSGISLGILSSQLQYGRIAVVSVIIALLAYVAYRWLFI